MARDPKELRTALEQLIDPICRAHGVELVDVRYQRERGGAVVRILIDQPRADEVEGSAVSLEHCTNVSRDVSVALDVHEDLLPTGAYRLEVGSPGLDRPLVKLSDFERFSGREIKIRTKAPIGNRRNFHGRLIGVHDQDIELEQDGQTLRIPYAGIAQANLVYRFSN